MSVAAHFEKFKVHTCADLLSVCLEFCRKWDEDPNRSALVATNKLNAVANVIALFELEYPNEQLPRLCHSITRESWVDDGPYQRERVSWDDPRVKKRGIGRAEWYGIEASDQGEAVNAGRSRGSSGEGEGNVMASDRGVGATSGSNQGHTRSESEEEIESAVKPKGQGPADDVPGEFTEPYGPKGVAKKPKPKPQRSTSVTVDIPIKKKSNQVVFGPTPPEIKEKRIASKISADQLASDSAGGKGKAKETPTECKDSDDDKKIVNEDMGDDTVEGVIQRALLVDSKVKPLKRGGLPGMTGFRIPTGDACKQCKDLFHICRFGEASACRRCAKHSIKCESKPWVVALVKHVKTLRQAEATEDEEAPSSKKAKKTSSKAPAPSSKQATAASAKAPAPSSKHATAASAKAPAPSLKPATAASSNQVAPVLTKPPAPSSQQVESAAVEPQITASKSTKRKASISAEPADISSKRAATSAELEPNAPGEARPIRPPRRNAPAMTASNSNTFVSGAATDRMTRAASSVIARSSSAPSHAPSLPSLGKLIGNFHPGPFGNLGSLRDPFTPQEMQKGFQTMLVDTRSEIRGMLDDLRDDILARMDDLRAEVLDRVEDVATLVEQVRDSRKKNDEDSDESESSGSDPGEDKSANGDEEDDAMDLSGEVQGQGQ